MSNINTTTKKLDAFHATPLQDCELSQVPSVGLKTLQKLKSANIDTAEKLVGQFLLLGRDTGKMTSWLKDVCEVRDHEATKVSAALADKARRMVEV